MKVNNKIMGRCPVDAGTFRKYSQLLVRILLNDTKGTKSTWIVLLMRTLRDFLQINGSKCRRLGNQLIADYCFVLTSYTIIKYMTLDATFPCDTPRQQPNFILFSSHFPEQFTASRLFSDCKQSFKFNCLHYEVYPSQFICG